MGFYLYKILSKFFGNKMIIKYYRNKGFEIGENTHIFSHIKSSEPYMISIGDNVTISTGVTLLTHDASVGPILGRERYSDMVGQIIIGDNCFIGANSIILCGVTIPDNSIVAAGTVVSKTITNPTVKNEHAAPDGIIIGGNPAKFICKTSDFLEKRASNFLQMHGKSYHDRKNAILSNRDKWLKK